MALRENAKGHLYLDRNIVTAVFDCVYGINGKVKRETKELLKDDKFREMMMLLLTYQDFNYRFRFEATNELFPIFEKTIGPMNRNSDGTALYLALGLVIQEMYGLKKETLISLLKLI